MGWEDILKVGLLLVGAAQQLAEADGMDPEAFSQKRSQLEADRSVAVEQAIAKLRAMVSPK